MKVLCIGGFKKRANCTVTNLSRRVPKIYDFDMVILDIPSGELFHFFEKLSAKKDEFIEFFRNGGTCFALSIPRLAHGPKTNYDWCPVYVYGVKSGETVICRSKRAKWLFDSISFRCRAYFSHYPDASTILAVNRIGRPISLHVPHERGHCIFLPYTDEKNELVKLLVRKGLTLVPRKRSRRASRHRRSHVIRP